MPSGPRDRLDRVFKPRSVAFYGASNDPLTMGTGQLANLILQGYQGAIYPVHPTEQTVLGLPAYPDIEHVPETPDLVVMVLPTGIVARLLDDCGRAGVRAAVVVSGGFREVGGRGVELERELAEVVERHGIALIGPNCIGVSNFHVGLNTTYFPYQQEPGGVTIISQSGTYSCHVYGFTRKLGVRLSHTVSVGNSLATDLADCIRYFADDPETRVIALYIEGIPEGEKFMEAARYAVARKPVVALYVGGTGAGARAGMSHTGAMAGDDDIYSGMLRQAGILRAYTIEEMLDWSWALETQTPPRGRRTCVLTNSGGPGASMADTCVRAGLEVPVLSDGLQEKLRVHLPFTAASVNPVDITFHMNIKDIYDRLPRLLLESGEIDGIVMYGAFGSMLFRMMQEAMGERVQYPVERVAPIILEMVQRFTGLPGEYGMPIVMSSFWGRDDEALEYMSDHGIPVYPSPERAVMAMAALYHRGTVLDKAVD
ncbi:MAG: CoA-binding protein [Actinobacteria bacterium]|nr:CoA-binding protein [Actinomycetota bacterium]MBU1944583.1 CoA-binding protein [Actinomycetota bacterium]MBU2689136.1 CoA-binding protein [Actinomycetota bacterium]